MHIFDNVFDTSFIEMYKQKIQSHFCQMLKLGCSYHAWNPTRIVVLDEKDIAIKKVQEFIESKIKIKTECYQAELQVWPIGTQSDLHVHNEQGRQQGDFNSLLYLNDDFEGGEFFTGDGVIIKPKTNRLTFFNGGKISHGVKKVEKNHRYTIIFWWKNTTNIPE